VTAWRVVAGPVGLRNDADAFGLDAEGDDLALELVAGLLEGTDGCHVVSPWLFEPATIAASMAIGRPQAIDDAPLGAGAQRRMLASLTPREERVLRMRFGIGINTAHTLEEVGQQLSVTRERIRQIEAKALRKLKHPSRSRVLRSFLDN